MRDFEDKLQSILGDPDAMGQIISIARSLSGSAAPEPAAPDEAPEPPPMGSEDPLSLLRGVDPRVLQLGIRLLSEYNRSDERTTALLNALQPFVREERYAKVDKAVQIARLSRLIRAALEAFRKGDVDFV